MAFYNNTSDDTNFSISFTQTPKYDFSIFAQGYRLAANSRAKELIESDHFADHEAYPVVFLYRHAFELGLKNIIYYAARLLSLQGVEDIDQKLQNTHRLDILSNAASKILIKAFPKEHELHEFLQKLISTAQDFSEIDPDSYAYRYPINTQGGHSTKLKQNVNLKSLAMHMDELLESLEDISFGLNIKTDVAQEVYEAYNSL